MAIWQASKPTAIDSRIRGKAFWNEEFKFLVLERVKDLIKDSDAVRLLPFILLFVSPTSFRKFSHFCSRPPFRVFTLESFFHFHFYFHFFIIFLLSFFFDCPVMHLTIRNSSRTGERFIKMILEAKILKEKPLQSKYPRSIKMDFSGM